MNEKYDIIVVGAGPSGSIAAKTTAEAGLKVLMIEKRQEIGDPVRCAEGIGKEGMIEHIQPDDRWICAKVKGSKIISPDGTEIKISEHKAMKEVGYTLERKIFDRVLAQKAAESGAEVRVKTRAIDLLIQDDKVIGIKAMYMGKIFEIKSDIVIGADGIESKVGRWAGIDTTLKPNEIETCAQFLVTNIEVDEYSKFYIGARYSPSGYIWLFPKGKNKANLGVGVLGSEKKKPIRLLHDFIEAYYPDSKILEIVVGGVPVSGPIKQTVTNGLILVGDAARLSDPLTGGGLINAMDSGKMAGKVCIKAKEKGDYSVKTLKEYEKLWRDTIGKNISWSLKIKNLFLKLNDKELNKLANSLKNEDVSKMDLQSMLKILFKKNPRMLLNIKHLL